jgi:predicted metallopeptidase
MHKRKKAHSYIAYDRNLIIFQLYSSISVVVAVVYEQLSQRSDCPDRLSAKSFVTICSLKINVLQGNPFYYTELIASQCFKRLSITEDARDRNTHGAPRGGCFTTRNPEGVEHPVLLS